MYKKDPLTWSHCMPQFTLFYMFIEFKFVNVSVVSLTKGRKMWLQNKVCILKAFLSLLSSLFATKPPWNECHIILLTIHQNKAKCSQATTDGVTRDPFYKRSLTLILAWVTNDSHHKIRDEITYPFLNFNGGTVEVWECISNLIPHFTALVITYPC